MIMSKQIWLELAKKMSTVFYKNRYDSNDENLQVKYYVYTLFPSEEVRDIVFRSVTVEEAAMVYNAVTDNDQVS